MEQATGQEDGLDSPQFTRYLEQRQPANLHEEGHLATQTPRQQMIQGSCEGKGVQDCESTQSRGDPGVRLSVALQTDHAQMLGNQNSTTFPYDERGDLGLLRGRASLWHQHEEGLMAQSAFRPYHRNSYVARGPALPGAGLRSSISEVQLPRPGRLGASHHPLWRPHPYNDPTAHMGSLYHHRVPFHTFSMGSASLPGYQYAPMYSQSTRDSIFFSDQDLGTSANPDGDGVWLWQGSPCEGDDYAFPSNPYKVHRCCQERRPFLDVLPVPGAARPSTRGSRIKAIATQTDHMEEYMWERGMHDFHAPPHRDLGFPVTQTSGSFMTRRDFFISDSCQRLCVTERLQETIRCADRGGHQIPPPHHTSWDLSVRNRLLSCASPCGSTIHPIAAGDQSQRSQDRNAFLRKDVGTVQDQSHELESWKATSSGMAFRSSSRHNPPSGDLTIPFLTPSCTITSAVFPRTWESSVAGPQTDGLLEYMPDVVASPADQAASHMGDMLPDDIVKRPGQQNDLCIAQFPMGGYAHATMRGAVFNQVRPDMDRERASSSAQSGSREENQGIKFWQPWSTDCQRREHQRPPPGASCRGNPLNVDRTFVPTFTSPHVPSVRDSQDIHGHPLHHACSSPRSFFNAGHEMSCHNPQIDVLSRASASFNLLPSSSASGRLGNRPADSWFEPPEISACCPENRGVRDNSSNQNSHQGIALPSDNNPTIGKSLASTIPAEQHCLMDISPNRASPARGVCSSGWQDKLHGHGRTNDNQGLMNKGSRKHSDSSDLSLQRELRQRHTSEPTGRDSWPRGEYSSRRLKDGSLAKKPSSHDGGSEQRTQNRQPQDAVISSFEEDERGSLACYGRMDNDTLLFRKGHSVGSHDQLGSPAVQNGGNGTTQNSKGAPDPSTAVHVLSCKTHSERDFDLPIPAKQKPTGRLQGNTAPNANAREETFIKEDDAKCRETTDASSHKISPCAASASQVDPSSSPSMDANSRSSLSQSSDIEEVGFPPSLLPLDRVISRLRRRLEENRTVRFLCLDEGGRKGARTAVRGVGHDSHPESGREQNGPLSDSGPPSTLSDDPQLEWRPVVRDGAADVALAQLSDRDKGSCAASSQEPAARFTSPGGPQVKVVGQGHTDHVDSSPVEATKWSSAEASVLKRPSTGPSHPNCSDEAALPEVWKIQTSVGKDNTAQLVVRWTEKVSPPLQFLVSKNNVKRDMEENFAVKESLMENLLVKEGDGGKLNTSKTVGTRNDVRDESHSLALRQCVKEPGCLPVTELPISCFKTRHCQPPMASSSDERSSSLNGGVESDRGKGSESRFTGKIVHSLYERLVLTHGCSFESGNGTLHDGTGEETAKQTESGDPPCSATDKRDTVTEAGRRQTLSTGDLSSTPPCQPLKENSVKLENEGKGETTRHEHENLSTSTASHSNSGKMKGSLLLYNGSEQSVLPPGANLNGQHGENNPQMLVESWSNLGAGTFLHNTSDSEEVCRAPPQIKRQDAVSSSVPPGLHVSSGVLLASTEEKSPLLLPDFRTTVDPGTQCDTATLPQPDDMMDACLRARQPGSATTSLLSSDRIETAVNSSYRQVLMFSPKADEACSTSKMEIVSPSSRQDSEKRLKQGACKDKRSHSSLPAGPAEDLIPVCFSFGTSPKDRFYTFDDLRSSSSNANRPAAVVEVATGLNVKGHAQDWLPTMGGGRETKCGGTTTKTPGKITSTPPICQVNSSFMQQAAGGKVLFQVSNQYQEVLQKAGRDEKLSPIEECPQLLDTNVQHEAGSSRGKNKEEKGRKRKLHPKTSSGRKKTRPSVSKQQTRDASDADDTMSTSPRHSSAQQTSLSSVSPERCGPPALNQECKQASVTPKTRKRKGGCSRKPESQPFPSGRESPDTTSPPLKHPKTCSRSDSSPASRRTERHTGNSPRRDSGKQRHCRTQRPRHRLVLPSLASPGTAAAAAAAASPKVSLGSKTGSLEQNEQAHPPPPSPVKRQQARGLPVRGDTEETQGEKDRRGSVGSSRRTASTKPRLRRSSASGKNTSTPVVQDDTGVVGQRVSARQSGRHWSGGSFPCPQCGQKYATRETLRRHMMLVHDLPFLDTKRYMEENHSVCPPTFSLPLQCPACGQVFLKKITLKRHVIKKHRDYLETKGDNFSPVLADCLQIVGDEQTQIHKVLARPEPVRLLTCPDCNRDYCSAGNLSRHMKLSHGKHLQYRRVPVFTPSKETHEEA